MGRLFLRVLAVLLLVVAGVVAAIAASIVVLMGAGDEVQAKGFTIDAQDLAGCPSFLIEVKSVDFGRISGDFLLGQREQYLSITSSPVLPLRSVVVEQSVVNDSLLGKSVCLIEATGVVVVRELSSGDQSLQVDDIPSGVFFAESNRILIPATLALGNSIVTSFTNSESTSAAVSVNGLLVYPNAFVTLVISGVASAVFVLGALGLLIVTRRKKLNKIVIEIEDGRNES